MKQKFHLYNIFLKSNKQKWRSVKPHIFMQVKKNIRKEIYE